MIGGPSRVRHGFLHLQARQLATRDCVGALDRLPGGVQSRLFKKSPVRLRNPPHFVSKKVESEPHLATILVLPERDVLQAYEAFFIRSDGRTPKSMASHNLRQKRAHREIRSPCQARTSHGSQEFVE